FWQPISKNNINNYYKVIKELIDLSTIDARLEAEQYIIPEDFIIDVQLIFNN
ncbi:hypothetical protein EDB80DRAFT_533031, partial [Ilyonectria destructans]